jgi:hypothetical protein
VSTGGISRYYQEEGYGTAACRSFSVGSNTTYTAIAMGARKQGASARGQARPCLWNNTSTGGGSSYSNFKYFKWKAGSIEQECLNQTWRTSSYVVETPGWPAKTYYFADALSITTAEALWNAMNTDIGKLTFWFGNDA